MKHVLITGAKGFLGRNLAAHLKARSDCAVVLFERGESAQALKQKALEADVIFHLAGVNRPPDPSEFETDNAGLTEQLCRLLEEGERAPKIVFSSSIQAEQDNHYGVSKAMAEGTLLEFAERSGAVVRIYRLKNLFGKWCRPNYNSVTATFCFNIANELPITLSDPSKELEVSYVDDVVSAFLGEIDEPKNSGRVGEEIPTKRILLGDLAGRIQAFHEMRTTLVLPEFSDPFNRTLYATYLSYLPSCALEQQLDVKSDPRGSLAEFVKQEHFGQIFVSRTKPGVTRGNHYHHTKTEKFLVVEGQGMIRMRSIEGGEVKEFSVHGEAYQVVNIPPGVTHSITNVGGRDMVTLFWSSEIFDPDRPDTYYLPVDFEQPIGFGSEEGA